MVHIGVIDQFICLKKWFIRLMIWLQQNFKTSCDFQIVSVHSFGGVVRAIFFLSNFSCLDSFLMQSELTCLKANLKLTFTRRSWPKNYVKVASVLVAVIGRTQIK